MATTKATFFYLELRITILKASRNATLNYELSSEHAGASEWETLAPACHGLTTCS